MNDIGAIKERAKKHGLDLCVGMDMYTVLSSMLDKLDTYAACAPPSADRARALEALDNIGSYALNLAGSFYPLEAYETVKKQIETIRSALSAPVDAVGNFRTRNIDIDISTPEGRKEALRQINKGESV